MAHPLRKMANFLGLVDDEGIELDEEMEVTEVEYTRPVPHRLERSETPSYLRNESVRPSSVRTTSPAVRPITSSAHSSDLTRGPVRATREASALDIVSLTPRVYSDAKTVGEHYRNGQTVVMNLTDMDDEERRRLVDFAAGLVFGHQGTIERVTAKVFLLTPRNVSVSNEDKQAAAHNFFNQS
jgi:cell division inhibitor SepF